MSAPIVITLADLQRRNACSDQLNLFRELFGEQITLTRELIPIAHKFHIDWLVERIFPDHCQVYYAATKPAWQAYNAATKQAGRAYDAAREPARQVYYAATEQALQAYDAAEEQARRAYDAARGQVWQVYYAATEQALQAYDAATEQASQAYRTECARILLDILNVD